MRIRNQKDFWSGVMLVVVGLAFAIFAREYDMGSAQRMGPGYFPTILGLLLAGLGVLIGARSLVGATRDGRIEKFHFDAMGWVLGAVVLFALLLRPAGLIVALIGLVVVSAFASHEFRLKETLLLTVALVALVLVVFIWGLKMTISVLPAFMLS